MDIAPCLTYKILMKYCLCIAALFACSAPAWAQSAPQHLSPVQQYLYNDTGYAPRMQAPAPEPVEPYDMVYAPESTQDDSGYSSNEHLNKGVTGMNF